MFQGQSSLARDAKSWPFGASIFVPIISILSIIHVPCRPPVRMVSPLSVVDGKDEALLTANIVGESGYDDIVATYSGDASFATSTIFLDEYIKTSTTTTLASSANPGCGPSRRGLVALARSPARLRSRRTAAARVHRRCLR